MYTLWPQLYFLNANINFVYVYMLVLNYCYE